MKNMMMKKLLPILAVAVSYQLSAVSCLWACPLCVNASPHKTGMLIAVFTLLPVPFVLAISLFLWIRRTAKAEESATIETPSA